MNGNPAEAKDTSNDGANGEDIDWTCGVGNVCWQEAPNDAAARDDGKHVKGEFRRETCGVGEFGDEEEWDVEADEAHEGSKGEEGEGQFFEAREVDDGLARER